MATVRSHPVLIVVLILLASPGWSEASEPGQPLDGWLSVVWGDSRPDMPTETHRRVSLTDDLGTTTRLVVSDELLASGVHRWNGRRVTVFPRDDAKTADGALRVAAIRLAASSDEHEAAARKGIAGSQPWISLLCKFADVSAEPRDLAFFTGMYANAPGRLDHYWREVSGGQVDIVGSTAVDWVDLPGDQTDYVPTPGSGTDADLNAIFNDCTAAVDAVVDFSGGGNAFVGINIMINDSLDCCAWGGSRFATLDGVTKSWRTTWNPPWAFANAGVIAHEMGHGFGLPHANNGDGDGDPYDSPWDVMSAATGNAVLDATYGRLGKHVNAYHKDQLGWFPAHRRFEPPADSRTSIFLEHTALVGGTGYQIARIDIDTNRWYTVEARRRVGDYETAMAGDAVIIHEVVLGRGEPSWTIDSDVPPADYGSNAGTMWTVGETFTDPGPPISVSVDYSNANGFGVTITVGDAGTVFANGFETGTTSEWTAAVP